jgi:hypothetical protein
MSTQVDVERDLEQREDGIERLLKEAKLMGDAYRDEQREPFCRPITLSFNKGTWRRITGFCKDISATGVGLLHSIAVEPGEVVLTIPCISGGPVHVRSEILWSSACRRGWYLSGARFVEVLSAAPGEELRAD